MGPVISTLEHVAEEDATALASTMAAQPAAERPTGPVTVELTVIPAAQIADADQKTREVTLDVSAVSSMQLNRDTTMYTIIDSNKYDVIASKYPALVNADENSNMER